MRCNQPERPFEATLDPARDAVSAALALVTAFVSAAAIDEDDAAKLAVIVEELVSNIVEHGQVPDGGTIGLSLALGERDVNVAITDPGLFHDPRAVEDDAELPPERGGGAGIRLVLAWSKILSYRRVRDCNELRLEVALYDAESDVLPT